MPYYCKADSRGWLLWWAARLACQALANVPDGATIDLAMAPRGEGGPGRARFSGTVAGETWEISAASPLVRAEDLAAALAFVRELVERERIPMAGDAERQALERGVEAYVFEPDGVVPDGDGVRLAEPDERTLLLVAAGVFRARFGSVWPCEDPAE